MKSKKILAMLLASAMVAGCLAGCGQKETTKEESKAESKVEESKVEESKVEEPKEEEKLWNEPGTLPIVKEEVTLKILTQDEPNHAMGHVQDSKVWAWLTEKTGIKFEIETYVAEDLKTKIPLIMSGNDLPDIFLRCDFTYGDLQGYANAGKIMALNDLIDEYGYYTKGIMEERPDAVASFYAADGNCYGLPRVTSSVLAGRSNYGINKDWLDRLGLEAPTNLDELYEVLKQFKEKDANGNGDATDEIPWSFTKAEMGTVMWTHATVGIATYWPITGAMFDDEDGEVYLVNTSEKYHDLLRFMSKCYKEGLIVQEAFTQSSAEQNELKWANRVGVCGAVGTQDWTGKACGQKIDYVGLVVGNGDNDPVFGRGAAFNPNLFHVSATTEYPEIAFMLGDYFYSPECSWLIQYGKPGESFNWVDEANYQFKQEAGQKKEYYAFVNVYLPNEWTQMPTDPYMIEYVDTMNTMSKTAFQHFLIYTAEETEQISILGTDLNTVLDEWMVHFVTGQKDVEKDWEEYLKLCDQLNAKEMVEIYQTVFDRCWAK